jgi:arylsulfatase
VQPDAGCSHHRSQHHSAAFASIAEAATGYDGYTAVLPRSTGTIGEVLRQNGYMTAWIGKNHNTPTWEASAAGPFDRWANGLGFDYFYGFNAGDMNHWNPVLFENRNLVPASADPNYHLTADLADKAIAWVRKVKSIAAGRPFFLYVAPGATHSPHHAPQDRSGSTGSRESSTWAGTHTARRRSNGRRSSASSQPAPSSRRDRRACRRGTR